jgi:excinuclease ABC subunit A
MATITAEASEDAIFQLDPRRYIIIKGARVHNLNNVNVAFPRNHFITVTGVSGSGKSSLTMDTLYAEGQRRYVESLSSYARQFLHRMNKPDVDYIKGICPAIAIEQKVTTRTSRSTVGTLTEVYDYLRLLFARIGRTYSPVSGEEVKKNDVGDVVDDILSMPEGTKVQILIPFSAPKTKKELQKELDLLLQKGYTRLWVDGKAHRIDDLQQDPSPLGKKKELYIIIDRLAVKHEDNETSSRLSESVQTAFFEGDGDCYVDILDEGVRKYTNRFERDGMTFAEPTPQFFNFNSPYGACERCEGFGHIIGIDEDLVIPDKNLSVYEGAVACWRGEKMRKWQQDFIKHAVHFDFPIHRAYKDLTDEEKALLWEGNDEISGIDDFFHYLERKSYKIQYRVLISRYRGRTSCPDCGGSRLRADAQYVKLNGKSIAEIVQMPVKESLPFFQYLELNEHEQQVANRLLEEINNRMSFMMDVGLSYLTLNRLSSTLSGGETQRINLTRALGSNLTDSLYILDEPTVGLHPRDTDRLVKVLHSLRDLGNTVVIVEHEEEVMRASDYIIDMGPEAGHLGGDVVFQGSYEKLQEESDGLTAQYLNGEKTILLPDERRSYQDTINIEQASQFNLKAIDVSFPLNVMTVVSGVSGSGKTTLVKDIFTPALKRELGKHGNKPGAFENITGATYQVDRVELIDQQPLGKSSRSNPVTYIKSYDAIRELFANQQLAKIKGLKPKHFSFNVDGGRCETCKGEGEVVVEMQFLADVHLTCEECNGKRFKDEVLEVTYKDKSIADVLEMTVDEAIVFFRDEQNIARQLQPLADVGLGYVKLGQSSSTLSGGEAQRVKLASFLGRGQSEGAILFIFDEPTTGLHFHDINKLLGAFSALINNGHTVIVIEHNMEIVKSADYVIDVGPEGGDEGGYLLYQGEPEGLVNVDASHTAPFLAKHLNKEE